MAKFTESEKLFLKCISDDRLLTSLSKIREAMEDIWCESAPRLVRDYTDHGEKHSARLVGFVDRLLLANDGKKLLEEEIYLLLAGIYLHDIGMQCDISKHSKIKEKAEEMGANFHFNFLSNSSSNYKPKEQDSIRENHQYLTAAWIDFAYTNENELSPTIKTVPSKFVSDLIDVCKYHSKLAITDCAESFTLFPTLRKRMVAALLRFADELDIGSERVTLNTVKFFSFNPNNSIYWWLHNHTTISFSSKNSVLIKISLHPEDMELYGSFIKKEYIDSFRTKNHPILNSLLRENITIFIDEDSGVVRDEYFEKFPSEIKSILNKMILPDKTDTHFYSLFEEVKIWLQAIGYEITDSQVVSDRIADMKITLEKGSLKQRVLIRCIGGEISSKDVEEIEKNLSIKIPQGWLITDRRVSPTARKKATEEEITKVFTFDEFLRQMVWGPYFDKLESSILKEKIQDLYVDIGCYKERVDEETKETGKETYSSLDEYIDNWLLERGKTHISLLGEFGTGKTWFCRHYAYRQLQRYLKDPVNQRLPLLITLRDFTKATTSQQLINDALIEKYKLSFVGSPFDILQELNRQGRLLLILDGFDEMANQVDYQAIVDNFWELAKLVDKNSKIILTSRTEYFRMAKESEKILGGKESGRNKQSLTTPEFEVLYLDHFTDDQIIKVILNLKGEEEGRKIANLILSQDNLAAMARKPVLIELLLAALEEVSKDSLENSAHVYLYATNKLLLRNIESGRTFTKTEDKLYFLWELAWEMIINGELKIHYKEIPERIKSYFGKKIKDQHDLDIWDFDLRNQTLLHRNAAGYYEFAHKSLAEYFVAFKLAAEIGALKSVFIQTYLGNENKDFEFVKKMEKGFNVLSKTFGLVSLTDRTMEAVYYFLKEMINKSEMTNRKLLQIVEYTKNKDMSQINYIGGNAVTLLNMNNVPFVGVDFSNSILVGANLSYVDLTGASFRKANLKNVNLVGSILENADFCEADFTNVKINDEIFSGIAWSPNGKLIAAVSNRELKVFDIARSKQVFSFLHEVPFRFQDNLIWSKSGSFLAFNSPFKSYPCNVWNTKDWTKVDNLYNCFSEVTFASDDVLIGVENEKIIVVNIKDFYNSFSFNYEQLSIRSMDVDDLGRFLVLVGFMQNERGNDKKGNIEVQNIAIVEIWDLLLRKKISAYRDERVDSQNYNVCFASSCNLIIVANTDEDIVIFDGSLKEVKLKLNHIIRKYEKKKNITAIGRSFHNFGLAFNSKTKQLAYSSIHNNILLYDMKSKSILANLEFPSPYSPIGVSYHPDGSLLASTNNNSISIWDIDPSSPNFTKCIKSFSCKMNCNNMKIYGAIGLNIEVKQSDIWGEEIKDKLLNFLASHGALLDQEQKNQLSEDKK